MAEQWQNEEEKGKGWEEKWRPDRWDGIGWALIFIWGALVLLAQTQITQRILASGMVSLFSLQGLELLCYLDCSYHLIDIAW